MSDDRRYLEGHLSIQAAVESGWRDIHQFLIDAKSNMTADFYRGCGLQIAAATRTKGAFSLHSADLTQPLFLLIGGERRGATRSLRESVDLTLTIPYGRNFEQSLGTVRATAVVAFEVMRQRKVAQG